MEQQQAADEQGARTDSSEKGVVTGARAFLMGESVRLRSRLEGGPG